MSLWKDDVNKIEQEQKTIRILVYPNITYLKDIEKDSYIQSIKTQITLLNSIRSDLWFYLILPQKIESLNFPNITQFVYEFPQHIPTMRIHFNAFEMYKFLSHDFDFDLIMCHLPEHADQLINLFLNKTHHAPLMFGYCHWFDLKEVTNWNKDSFNQNMIGLLNYDRCYLNTKYQKQMVLKQASSLFNDQIIQKLDTLLVPQHLGVMKENVTYQINETPEKIIVFNHRPDTYKFYNNFLSITDELWKKRQDFKVWIPLAQKKDREYIFVDKFDKIGYYNRLKDCCVGFSPKQTYGGWSVATTDGMMNGVPYIMYDELYYKELQNNCDFYKTNDEAILLLDKYLDDFEYRNMMANKALDHINSNLLYIDEIKEMSEYIDLLIDKYKVSNTKRTDDIISFIEENKKVTKKEIMKMLGWGKGIPWTKYRRTLMKHPNIFDMNCEIPTYIWKD